MYVSALVCLCGYTRVPPTMPSAPIPGQGVVTAVPVGSRPSLCPFCVHLPHAFSFYNIYVIAVVLGLRQVYTKWALRRRPRCPPGVP